MLFVFTAFSQAPVNAAETASLTVQQTVTTLGTATDPYSAYRFHLELFGPAVTISGQIIWNDFNNAYGARPVDVNIFLQRNGITVDNVVIDAAQNWQFSFRNRAKYDENGNAYIYTVSQANVDNYTTIQSGFDFINSIGTVSVTSIYWDETSNREIARETRIVPYNSSLVLVPPSLGGYTLDRPKQVVLFQIKAPVQQFFFYIPNSTTDSDSEESPDEEDPPVPPEEGPAVPPEENQTVFLPKHIVEHNAAFYPGGIMPKHAAPGSSLSLNPSLQTFGIVDSGVAPIPIPAAELARLQLAGYNIVSDGGDGYFFTLQGGHSITIQSLLPETQFVVTQLGAIQAGTAVSLDPEACTVDLLNAAGAFAGYPVAAGTVIAGAVSTAVFNYTVSATPPEPEPAPPPAPLPTPPETHIPPTGDRILGVWFGIGIPIILILSLFLRKKHRR